MQVTDLTRPFSLLAVLVSLAGTSRTAAADLAPEQVEFFEKKIRPVLVDTCYDCHSGTSKDLKAGYRLDFRDAMRKGGQSGHAAVVPGQPGQSALIRAIKRVDDKTAMPPKAEKRLTPQQVADFEAWVAMGAPDPRPAVPVALDDPAVKARNHWAFKKPVDPKAPPVANAGWAKSDLDRFVLAKLEEKKLSPAAPAGKAALIRRATFDLHGLPPTPQEVEAFVSDASADAFATVVDRLLASPRYGERWGRYWLDVARYADTKGYVFEEERRFAYSYTYRDWVIRALNEDLPYDQFLVQQIAADRLPLGDDKRPLAALGFLTVGRRFLNNQADIIDDRIDVVTRGTMALTVQCARCHDHKYDPVPTADYYSLYGVFASTTESKNPPAIGSASGGPDGAAFEAESKKREAEVRKFLEQKHAELTKQLRTADAIADYLTAVYDLRHGKGTDRKAYLQEHDLRRGVIDRYTAFLDNTKENPTLWPYHAFAELGPDEFAAKAPHVVESVAKNEKKLPLNPLAAALFVGQPAPKTMREVADRYGKLLASVEQDAPHADPQREGLRNLLRGPGTPTAFTVDDVQGLFRRDDQNRYRDLRKKVDELHASHPGAPARPMAVEDLPQPAEPRIFNRGNVNNPGAVVPRQFLSVVAGEGRKPFTDGSGRLEMAKAIASKDNPLTARVMVNRVWLSHFGQGLVATPSDFGLRSDPPSHPELLDWLSHRFMEDGWSLKKLHRRMMLSATYQQDSVGNAAHAAVDPENRLLWRQNRRRLDFESMRDSLIAVTGRMDFAMGGKGVDITGDSPPPRRTVYGYIERQNLPGIFRTFDFASPDTHSPQRFFTTVPQQALFMMNSPFVIQQAKALAARPEVAAEADPAKRVALLYRLVYGREPADRDVTLGVEFTRAEEGPAPGASPWAYGYGKYDEAKQRLTNFKPLPHFANGNWQGGPNVPNNPLGWVTVGAGGGHPGAADDRAAVRRFTVPADGKLTIDGQLKHEETPGNGVRGRIVSGRSGELASYSVHKSEARTRLENLDVKAGDTIDFVVDWRGEIGWDSFAWAPTLRLTRPQLPAAAGNEGVTEFNAATDFAGPATAGKLAAWEKYCQVLLQSNEFAFVD